MAHTPMENTGSNPTSAQKEARRIVEMFLPNTFDSDLGENYHAIQCGINHVKGIMKDREGYLTMSDLQSILSEIEKM